MTLLRQPQGLILVALLDSQYVVVSSQRGRHTLEGTFWSYAQPRFSLGRVGVPPGATGFTQKKERKTKTARSLEEGIYTFWRAGQNCSCAYVTADLLPTWRLGRVNKHCSLTYRLE